MATSLENVIQQIQDTGLVAPGTLANFIPPKATVQSVDELLRNLSKQQHLTKFQAMQVGQGKARALVLGSYTILDKIGAGGMGQVYKAEHRRMKRVVAIKTLPAAMMKDKSVVARFQREVEAAAKLNHPNIVTAHDADEGNGLHFLVMEHVQGTDLSALVKQEGPVPVDQAVNFILQAARGLEYAHQKGVIHRDIKPANLLLDNDGTIKILDMGLARIEGTENSPPPDDLTATGTVMGTVDYMAPEQWANTHTADARCDLYALGCTLCFLLIGRAPYADDEHRNPVAKMKGHVQEPIPDLRTARPDVPDGVISIYQKLMAKKAEDRYSTATALIAALASIAPNAVVETKFPGSQRPANSRTAVIGTAAIPKAEEANPTQVSNDISSSSVEALIDAARQLFDAHDYAGVIGLLENIPQQTRTEAMDSILEKATERQAECDRLLLEIDDARRLHKPKLLLTKAEQLLKLKPGHSPTRRLLKSLKSYGGKLEAAKFNAGDELLTLQEASGILKGLGTYYIACIATAVMAFGVGSAMIYSYLGPSKSKQPVDSVGAGSHSKETVPPAEMVPPVEPPSGEEFTSSSHTELIPTFKTPAFEEWSRKVASMSADQQLEAVSQKLQELNPGFKGKLEGSHVVRPPKIVDGVVTGCGLITDHVTDISPVRAFVGLRNLKCVGSAPGNGLLSDLSPLTGMPLNELIINNSPVFDLSPLKGMNLTKIAFTPANITIGLDVIRQMKSLKTIGMRGDRDKFPADEFWKKYDAGEFNPPSLNEPAFKQWMKDAQAMPAEQQVDAVTDKLRELNPKFKDKVTHKIQKGVVREFGFKTDYVADIRPLKALAGLRILDCCGNYGRKGHLTSLAVLEGMKLNKLFCRENPISDISPLRGMPLTELHIAATYVEDLSPLQGMRLNYLGCWSTPLSDLSPLKGMPLLHLNCGVSKVADLSPLEGMKLTRLECTYTRVADLSPLNQMTTLRLLDVVKAKVTAEKVEALQKVLPDCKIELQSKKTK